MQCFFEEDIRCSIMGDGGRKMNGGEAFTWYV